MCSDYTHHKNSREQELGLVPVLSRKCVWNIVRVLLQTRNNMINITALVNALRTNYDYVMKCLTLMEKYGIVEMAKIGRLRLVKLNTSSGIVNKMVELLESNISSSSW